MSWNSCKFPWWLSSHWPRRYPSVYQGSKKAEKPWERIQILKNHIKGKIKKKKTHRVSTNGVSDVMKFIHGDRFRFLPMEDISYSTTLGEVFLCSSVFLTCFYHDNVIMHPISSCFGIFSLSKACRFSISVCEWVPQSSPVVVSRQYLQTEKPAAFYDSVQLQNKMDFCFLFFSRGVF